MTIKVDLSILNFQREPDPRVHTEVFTGLSLWQWALWRRIFCPFWCGYSYLLQPCTSIQVLTRTLKELLCPNLDPVSVLLYRQLDYFFLHALLASSYAFYLSAIMRTSTVWPENAHKRLLWIILSAGNVFSYSFARWLCSRYRNFWRISGRLAL